MFSVDLVAAVRLLYFMFSLAFFSNPIDYQVMRQAAFVEKMHKLRWLEPPFWDKEENELPLLHGIARYHA